MTHSVNECSLVALVAHHSIVVLFIHITTTATIAFAFIDGYMEWMDVISYWDHQRTYPWMNHPRGIPHQIHSSIHYRTMKHDRVSDEQMRRVMARSERDECRYVFAAPVATLPTFATCPTTWPIIDMDCFCMRVTRSNSLLCNSVEKSRNHCYHTTTINQCRRIWSSCVIGYIV